MMRLSEAIRLGAISCKWGQGKLVRHDGSRCAFGMAYLAIGQAEIRSSFAAMDLWPWTMGYTRVGSELRIIHSVIMEMNDMKLKTPLEIADWVESLERERGLWDDEVQPVEREACALQILPVA